MSSFPIRSKIYIYKSFHKLCPNFWVIFDSPHPLKLNIIYARSKEIIVWYNLCIVNRLIPIPYASSKCFLTTFKSFLPWSKVRFYLITLHLWARSKIFSKMFVAFHSFYFQLFRSEFFQWSRRPRNSLIFQFEILTGILHTKTAGFTYQFVF